MVMLMTIVTFRISNNFPMSKYMKKKYIDTKGKKSRTKNISENETDLVLRWIPLLSASSAPNLNWDW